MQARKAAPRARRAEGAAPDPSLPPAAGLDRPQGVAARPEEPRLGRDEILAYYARTGYSLEHHAAHLIRRAHQRATAMFQEIMGADELTPTQLAVMAVVLKQGALSQNHLGRLTAMDPSTVSLVVRALAKRGLIVRRSSATDQRMAMITLTDQGVHYTLERLDSSMEVARGVLRPLSAAEQATFLDLLRRVSDGGEGRTATDAEER